MRNIELTFITTLGIILSLAIAYAGFKAMEVLNELAVVLQ